MVLWLPVALGKPDFTTFRRAAVRVRTSQRMPLCNSSEDFFIAPNFQLERTFGGFEDADHVPDATPSAFFIKSGGTVISDGTGKPSLIRATFGEPRFSLRHTSRRDA